MVEPRPPAATVKFVDEYCQWYEKLFLPIEEAANIGRDTRPILAA
ncbi:MAG: hypothetical protein N4J56_007048 [Chroococcidiopsis sp. SAG 2025]|nr:hypothetical protein [Chroococcidiopsis sp. SAG 2025]